MPEPVYQQKEKIDFDFIVNENIREASKFMREGDVERFMNAVEVLSILLDTYKDDDFNKEFEKLKRDKEKEAKNPEANKKKIMLWFYKEYFRLLINLLPRTELWPMPYVEGILTKEDVEEAEKVQYKHFPHRKVKDG